jgi:hypothetical protein
MFVGDYVRQLLFKGIAGKYGNDQKFEEPTYRYGIVTKLKAPERKSFHIEKALVGKDVVEVYFTPTSSHPVSNMPYREYVLLSSLEKIS